MDNIEMAPISVVEAYARELEEGVIALRAKMVFCGTRKTGTGPDGEYSTQNIDLCDEDNKNLKIKVRLEGFAQVTREDLHNFITVESTRNESGGYDGIKLEMDATRKPTGRMLIVKKSEGGKIWADDRPKAGKKKTEPQQEPAAPAPASEPATAQTPPASTAPQAAAASSTAPAPASSPAKPNNPLIVRVKPNPGTRSAKVFALKDIVSRVLKTKNAMRICIEAAEQINAERVEAKKEPLPAEHIRTMAATFFIDLKDAGLITDEIPTDNWIEYREEINERKRNAIMPEAFRRTRSPQKQLWLEAVSKLGARAVQWAVKHNILVEGQSLDDWPENCIPANQTEIEAALVIIATDTEPVVNTPIVF